MDAEKPATAEAATIIREYRQTRGLTLHQLAALLGVHWTTISRWEHGHQSPPGRVIELALIGLDTVRASEG